MHFQHWSRGILGFWQLHERALACQEIVLNKIHVKQTFLGFRTPSNY